MFRLTYRLPPGLPHTAHYTRSGVFRSRPSTLFAVTSLQLTGLRFPLAGLRTCCLPIQTLPVQTLSKQSQTPAKYTIFRRFVASMAGLTAQVKAKRATHDPLQTSLSVDSALWITIRCSVEGRVNPPAAEGPLQGAEYANFHQRFQ